jgi:hypothetical protein
VSDEDLRSLERAVVSHPGAGTWSALATALARAGRGAEASRAALKAVGFDPGAAARELIAPSWVGDRGGSRLRAVQERGMRRLVPPRAVREVPGGRVIGAPYGFPAVIDLGGGRAMWLAGEELLGVDVLAGAVLWRRARPERFGLSGTSPSCFYQADGRHIVETLDPCTGVSIRRTVLEVQLDSRLQALGRYIVAEEWDENRAPQTRVLELASGRSIRVFTGEALAGLLEGELVLVQADGTGSLRGFDLEGRTLWRTGFNGRPRGFSLGDQCLVSEAVLRNGRFGFFDLATGEPRGTLTPPTLAWTVASFNEDVLVVSCRERPIVHDRRTLAVLWDRLGHLGRAEHGALTGDAFLEVLGDQELELVSVDPRTGEELARVSLEAWGPLPERASRVGGRAIQWRFEVELALVAGRVLIFSGSDARPLLIVEESLA